MVDKISIIMPAFNAEKYISECIESILQQSYPNWELIIVDDGSRDNTAAIIKAYQQKDGRIQCYSQENGKQGKARNAAIQNSVGRYLAFMDADDVWNPNKLSHQLNLIQARGVDLVFGYSFQIEGSHKTENKTGRGLGCYQGNHAIEFLLFHEAFLMSSVLVEREAMLKAGGFVEDLRIQYCEDWHMWLNLALQGCSFFTDGSVLSYYRVHTESAAKMEKHHEIKLFFALLDLHYKYTDNTLVAGEVKKRANALVFHSNTLSEDLVNNIVEFLTKNHLTSVPGVVYQSLYKLNEAMFRKFYLFLNEKRSPHLTLC